MKKNILLPIGFICLFYFKTFCQILPPDTNTFDNPNDTIGWSHYATIGTDDWQLGAPSYYSFSQANSLPNAWVTNLNGPYSLQSTMMLETPYYDLSDTAKKLIISFNHKLNVDGNIRPKVEYSINQGLTWQLLLNSSSKKSFWFQYPGFTGTFDYKFAPSKHSLDFLAGQSNVKFRFVFNSNSTIGTQIGWMIDDFIICEETYNIKAHQGEDITGINKNFPSFEVNPKFDYYSEWGSFYSQVIQSEFYLSYDHFLDSTDVLLSTINHHAHGIPKQTFPFPTGLKSGIHYIIYKFDVNNSLIEYDETDNISFTRLIVDSLYSTPYRSNFEGNTNDWTPLFKTPDPTWIRTNPNYFLTEGSRSGNYAWAAKNAKIDYNLDYLESPYIDLSNSINSVFCFWYKTSIVAPSNNNFFFLNFPLKNIGSSTFPIFEFYNKIIIQKSNDFNWNCHCEDISQYDGEKSFKLILAPPYSMKRDSFVVVLDDIYIGEPLPDVTIEGIKKNRFSTYTNPNETIKYHVYNPGPITLPITTTKFYWSTDSILDSTDIFLGTNTEPQLSANSKYLNSFSFTKPNSTSSKFFILYELDSQEIVTEMNEDDNFGFIEFHHTFFENIPYYNDFETSINGWRHNSTVGKDDWSWSVPKGIDIDTAFSGKKAFVTNPLGSVSKHSRMHLYSPVFDINQLTKPILEFDLLVFTYKSNNYGNASTDQIGANIMYSINGGATWEILEPKNKSYKRMYSRIELASINSVDLLGFNSINNKNLLFGYNLSSFNFHLDYQGRDYDDNHHNVIDLSFLKGNNQVQFMFVLANKNTPMEGMLVDNFKISEGEIDLIIDQNTRLLMSSSDKYIKQNIKVKNNNNYISQPSSFYVYLSADTMLDSSDNYLGVRSFDTLKPFESTLININYNSPLNLKNYNYLIFNLDPTNQNLESNEANNIKYLELNMDSASNLKYPKRFTFNKQVDGWNWYHDSSGFYHGQRFRNKIVLGEPAADAKSGEWFLDPVDNWGNYPQWYPTHYLESPTFDFTIHSNIKLEFDFLCIGSTSGTSSGGNIQYSTDGGVTWHVLTDDHDTNAENWYTIKNVGLLNNEPGWGHHTNHKWKHASIDISFLSKYKAVKFRFKFKSFVQTINYVSGFRLDNFKITTKKMTLLSTFEICDGESVNVFGNNVTQAGAYYKTINSTSGNDSTLVILVKVKPLPQVILNPFNPNTICSSHPIIPLPIGTPNGGIYSGNGVSNLHFDPIISGIGTHKVYYSFTDSNVCTSIDSSFISVQICQGINEYSLDKYSILNIYPNPTSGIILIEKLKPINEDILLKVLNVESKIILTKYFQKDKNHFSIDISKFSKGVYFLNIETKDNTLNFKIIKE